MDRNEPKRVLSLHAVVVAVCLVSLSLSACSRSETATVNRKDAGATAVHALALLKAGDWNALSKVIVPPARKGVATEIVALHQSQRERVGVDTALSRLSGDRVRAGALWFADHYAPGVLDDTSPRPVAGGALEYLYHDAHGVLRPMRLLRGEDGLWYVASIQL